MELLLPYGVAATIIFPLIDRDTNNLLASATLTAGDFKIIKDEGASANTNTTTPTDETGGLYSLALTATEMSAARIAILCVDQTAAKDWEDTIILIRTYGHPSAGIRTNERIGTAQAGAAGTITLDSGANATNDFYNDMLISIIGGTGVGQSRLVSDYVGASKVATIEPDWVTTPDNTSIFHITPASRVDLHTWLGVEPNVLVSGRVDASVGAMAAAVVTATAIATDAIDADAIAANAIDASAIADGAIDDAALAADVDTYQAKVWLFDDDGGTTDRYVVAWFKNAQPYRVGGGITSPTIQVVKVADGSDLIASTALTEISTTEVYRYNATTTERITDGVAYFAIVTATIDGASREWVQPIGRDS